MNKYNNILLIPILGLLSLITISLLAFKFRINGLLIIISLVFLPAYVVIALRLLTKVSTFISAQIAFSLALWICFVLITFIDNRMNDDQSTILFLVIIPFFAIYSLATLLYILVYEKYNFFGRIFLFYLDLGIIVATFNWWYSTDYPFDPKLDPKLSAMLLIYLWISLISIVYLAFRRKHGFANYMIPLAINLISIIAIWTTISLITPEEINYRYYWRQDGFNVIVQEIETSKLKPENGNINLPDRYRYLAYDGWVRAGLINERWAILFYDSPPYGYLYLENGLDPATFAESMHESCGNMRRINANWFYCGTE
jgi:hypothetical protein